MIDSKPMHLADDDARKTEGLGPMSNNVLIGPGPQTSTCFKKQNQKVFRECKLLPKLTICRPMLVVIKYLVNRYGAGLPSVTAVCTLFHTVIIYTAYMCCCAMLNEVKNIQNLYPDQITRFTPMPYPNLNQFSLF